ncbi:MAG TPA: FtsX-like permease family protein [Acidimicrobiales bacterium]|nr:FtsX-like permease family protein [Acidimicrobiales bacterium]
MKALGFTRSQVLAAVLWNASIVIGIALAVGVPFGIIGGRLIWSTFSRQVGVPAVSIVPWGILAIVAAGAAIVADFVALAPAAAAARTRTAAALRSE